MKDIRNLLYYLHGVRSLFLLGMISIIISQLFYTAGPLILSTSIDSIIGSEPINNNLARAAVNLMGGRILIRSQLWIIGLVFILNTIFRGLFLYFKGYFSAKASEAVAMNIRNTLYDHIQKLPYSYHVHADTGDLIQRCTSDVETIRRFLGIQLVEVAGSLFMLLFIMISMVSLNLSMSIASMALVPFIFGFAYLFFKRIQKDFKSADEAEAELSTALQENLTGIRVVKAFAREKYELDKFDVKNSNYRILVNKLIENLAVYWSLSDFLSMLQVGVVIVYGTILVVRGDITLGILVAFITYVNMLIWPVRQLGRILTDMGKTTVSVDRINEILLQPIEDLVENDREYKIAGIELREINRKWIRKNISLVLQEPFLYARNIRENIRLTNPNRQDKSVIHAAKTASIHEDILSFDRQYETMVGEKGVSLSGGQKQRMTIARAIIADAPIVIFDDSLSAVDTETDLEIRNALKSRKKHTTTIVISHRISTVMDADKILVLDKGQIVQSGSHKELISQDGLYKRIYKIQSSL